MLPAPVSPVTRPLTRILVLVLVVVSAVAVWAWFRPYAWGADPAARFHIQQAQVRRDYAEYWVKLALEQSGPQGHDLTKPVVLETSSGRQISAVDSLSSKDENGGKDGLWLEFILDEKDLAGPLKLRLNDGLLIVKSKGGVPTIASGDSKVYSSNGW